jgi:hypothetical protein
MTSQAKGAPPVGGPEKRVAAFQILFIGIVDVVTRGALNLVPFECLNPVREHPSPIGLQNGRLIKLRVNIE